MACSRKVASDDIEPKPTFVSLPSDAIGRRYCGVEDTGRVYATLPVRKSRDARSPERSEKNSSLPISLEAGHWGLEHTVLIHLELLC